MANLKVGFGRMDITPEEYTTLAGFGNDSRRRATIILDRLQGTCIAFEDETGKRMIFCTVDLLNAVSDTVVAGPRKSISAATGIPEDHIMVSVTHTHSAPSMYSWNNEETNRYLTFYCKQLAKAAKQAIEDLAQAEVFVGQRNLPGMAFVRRYIRVNDILQHLAQADDQVQVMRFVRENARDIVLVNWQAHVTFIGYHETDSEISADFVGHMRNHVEGSTGCHCAYFQGGAGNQAGRSRIPGNSIVPFDCDRFDGSRTYGKLLADGVIATLEENMRPVSVGPIQLIRTAYDAVVDHSTDDQVEQAKIVQAGWYNYDTYQERVTFSKSLGFNGLLHANQVVNRSNMPPLFELELDTIAIGDISFATLPFEMFASNCKFIKDNTPFPMTFVLAYSNGSNSYLPDDAAFEHDIYEVNTRKFVRGTAEALADTHLELLQKLHG